jgi:phage gp29-like protein
MPEDKQNELLRTLSDLSQETAIIAPLEAEIALLEAARTGTIDTYERLVRYMDEEISKAVLGETLTTTLGNAGSYAASKTHNEVRLELVRSDADLLSATLHDTLLTWLTALHFPGAGVPRVWRKVEAAVDLKAEAEKDQIVAGMGFDPDEDWVQEKYGQGWKKKAKPEPPPPPAPNPAPISSPAPSPAPASFAEGGGKDSAARLSDAALAHSGKALAALLEPVQKAVDESGSLPELRERLDRLYPELDATAFSELMEQAFLLAALAGRFDVLAGK